MKSLSARTAVLALAAALVLATAARAPAATFVVTTTADVIDPNDGKVSLREAVLAANTSNGKAAIALPAGTCTLTLVGADEDAGLTGDLDITGHVTIQGAGAGATIVDGGGLDRVFHVLPDVTVTLTDMTIQGGNAATGVFRIGGGIWNEGKLTLENCTVKDNTADYTGGAIFNGFSFEQIATLTVKDCSLTGNSAGQGGAIFNEIGSDVAISRSNLSGNFAMTGGASGGAILNNGDTMTVTDCILSCNSARIGGAVCAFGSVTIAGSTLSNNCAVTEGGAIWNSSVLLSLTDTMVTDNDAGSNGGGVWNNGYAWIGGSTFTGNSAPQGGAFFVWNLADVYNSTFTDNGALEGGAVFSNGALDFHESTVSGNFATDGGGIYVARSTTTLAESTVSGNEAEQQGGGVDNASLGTLAVKDSIVCDNTAPAGMGPDVYNEGSLSIQDSDVCEIDP